MNSCPQDFEIHVYVQEGPDAIHFKMGLGNVTAPHPLNTLPSSSTFGNTVTYQYTTLPEYTPYKAHNTCIY